jgi:HPt (histidine-containing phosphotransfer) domain-containing protein
MLKKEDNRVVVNDPFARRLMDRYLDKRRADIPALRSALAAGDFDSIRDKGHNLFGSGSAYGLDRISEIGAALEKTAKKRDGVKIAQLIDTLDTFVTTVHVV